MTEHGKECEVIHNGVIHIAKHCVELEHLHINVSDMTNEVMKYIGKKLKKLKDFSLYMWQWTTKHEPVLDYGVRSLLIGCNKLEKLGLYSWDYGGCSWLTDKGLGFIAKHGCNLRYLYVNNIDVKLSDAGVMELSKLGYRCRPNSYNREVIISGRNVKGIPQPCRDIE
ncbi:coronatine-insensitive protein 1-like [Rutidosis leptorrhynchoides]|uniref:coronatine-insensitive protein 1-like n=1 Tax=Rutidosis leptorrhynchoides TaxID=125765 RepID=UPI003A996E7E